MGHIGKVCHAPKKKASANTVAGTQEPAQESGDVALLSPTTEGSFFFAGEVNRVGIHHHIFTRGTWKPRKVRPHPMLEVQVRVDWEVYNHLGV